MPLWNLSSLDDLETTVTTAQNPASIRRRGEPQNRYKSSSIRTAMRVAALAAISYNTVVCGTSVKVGVVQEVARTASNVDENRTPLDDFFRNRFNDSWTKEKEDALLAEAVKKAAVPERDVVNLVHTAQQETLDSDLPRLSEDVVLKLARRKA